MLWKYLSKLVVDAIKQEVQNLVLPAFPKPNVDGSRDLGVQLNHGLTSHSRKQFVDLFE